MRASHTIYILYAVVLLIVFFATPSIVHDVAEDTAITPFFAPEQSFDPFVIVLFAVFVAVFSFIIIKFQAVRIYLLRLIEAGSIIVSSSVIFYALGRLLLLNPEMSMFASGILALGILVVRYVLPQFRNGIVLFTCAGAAILLGMSFTPLSIAVFLVLLSIYDYIAVYKTKHMHELARVVHREDFMMSFQAGSGTDRLELGTGDVIVPAALVASATVIAPFGAMIIGLSVLFALLLLIILVTRRKELTAALPILALGTLIGYGFTLLFGILTFY